MAGRRELLRALLDVDGADFGGILSGLYAGDRLVAAHLGLRSNGVLHWWFPVYDPELARFGPGWMLLRELMLAGPELGLTRIDLGRGDDEYKRRAKTGEVVVCEGRVESGSLGRRVRAMKRQAVSTLPRIAIRLARDRARQAGAGTGARRGRWRASPKSATQRRSASMRPASMSARMRFRRWCGSPVSASSVRP